LLAQVLLIAQNRKSDYSVNFYTPFLVDASNLKIINQFAKLKERPIYENLKVEKFFMVDIDAKKVDLYDQYLDKTFSMPGIEGIADDIDFVLSRMSKKNIVYLNRPKIVEELSLKASIRRSAIKTEPEIDKIIKAIADLIHPKYNLIKCIRKGLLFHHGGMPDMVRLYVEEIYQRYAAFEFVVTTSTLLEGVNIPAEKIFVLNPRKGRGNLTTAQFKNLIGRICRFKEVFDEKDGSMSLLEPSVYLVKGNYAPANFSLQKFYEKRVKANIKIEDDVENPLLEKTQNSSQTKEILEYLENMEPGASGLKDVITPKTEVGVICYANYVNDFNILQNEKHIAENLEAHKKQTAGLISSAEELINAIVFIFFRNVDLFEKEINLTRIKEHTEAQHFYSMFINWRSKGTPYKIMIQSFLKYWHHRDETGAVYIYVGPRWGETSRDEGPKLLYVDLREKDEEQRVNLAVVKIKEEQEFIDFHILKYLEVLNELHLVDVKFYDHVKYGTSDGELICLLKNGFSNELAQLLVDKYRAYLHINTKNDIVKYDEVLIKKMKSDDENDILIFEAENNL
jgi:hypothetical protein